jgi:uncharacterized protein YeeX (DUF496 family)
MRVGFIQSIIANKKPDYEIAVVWFDKTDAEMIAEDDLSPAEWQVIVQKFSSDKYLNRVADVLIADLVKEALEKRGKAE